MTTYIYASTIIFAFLTLIWESSNWLNLSIRTTLFVMTVFGVALSMQSLGYIVKT